MHGVTQDQDNAGDNARTSFVVPAGSVPPLPETPPEVPVVPKDSATVVLLRDAAAGPGVEVFLQRRVTKMAFAAGMTVFPGGGVDERDADAAVRWIGPRPREWARAFGCSEAVARSLVCAAVRETFEESGVLLAGTESGTVTDTGPYAEARADLVSGELSLARFLAKEGLALRADLLRPWANWVTPEPEPRRYDARFFVAALPEGQVADGNTTEAESTRWQRPSEALADAAGGRSNLMLPTSHTLEEVSRFGSVAEILAVRRTIRRIMPTLTRDGDRVRVEW